MKKTLAPGAALLTGLLMVFLSSYAPFQQKTAITVTGIRSDKGKIIIQVFKDDAAYQDQHPFKKISFDKKELASGTLQLQLALEPGTYGFTLVDDENGNGEIDKNFVGMPKEGFGFSNFFMEKMKKPRFEEFKTDLKTHPTVVMKVKYM